MSQKSILSFFKAPVKATTVINNENSGDGSPVKKLAKKIKVLVESDDEEASSNNSPEEKKISNGHGSENTTVEDNKKKAKDATGNGSQNTVSETQDKSDDSDQRTIKESKKIKGKRKTKKDAASSSVKKRKKTADSEESNGESVTSKCKKLTAISDSDDELPVNAEKEEREEDGDEAKEEKSLSQKEKKPVHNFFDPKKKASKSSKSEKKSSEEKINMTSTQAKGVETDYNPSKIHYHPIKDACWKKGEKVPYLALAKTLDLIGNISGRLKSIEILANYFRSTIVLTPEDLLASVYLCSNRLAPEYENIELGVGETLLMKAVAQATGRTVDKIKKEVEVKGDLGLVAENSRGNQKVMFAPPKLTVASVFSKFKEIAKMSGNVAMAKKTDKIQAMFVACRDCEAKYIIRSLSGKLRIGLAENSILAALAQAVTLTPPSQSYPPEIVNASSGISPETFKKKLEGQALMLKTTYCECPNYDLIIPVLLKEGISKLSEHCQICAGRPVKPMLAHPTKAIADVLRRFDGNEFTCEFKYDGERAQIHMNDNGEITIFSRNQENNTSKYPDIIARMPKCLKENTKSFILDSEAVAWDTEKKQILPFQVLSTRKKKAAVESQIVVQVCVVAFDLLFLNGESLVTKPLKERRNLLMSTFQELEDQFMFVKYKDSNNAETMQEFLAESVKENCEGLMVKALEVDASYEIAKRSHNWLKLKKDYVDGHVGDSIDLVVIGGYHGKGKRTGTYGGFLLACYANEDEEFQSICKIGVGFKDEDLQEHTNFLKTHVISQPKSYYCYDSSVEPDVWFEPVQVWEIECADLSISPIHKAAIGIVHPEKGISLRFPRFLRIRTDKNPEDATNSAEIAEMYNGQEQVQNQKNTDAANEDDYY